MFSPSRRALKLVCGSVLSVALMYSYAADADAAPRHVDSAQAVSKAAGKGAKVESAPVGDGFVGKTLSGDVILPEESHRGVSIGGEVRIGLPGENRQGELTDDAGTAIYADRNSDVDYAAQVTSTGARVLVVLKNAKAPRKFVFPISGPAGSHLRNIQTADSGTPTVGLVGKDGLVLGTFAAPWAKDANGASVSTRFEIQGNNLVQTVHPDASAAYPVVADPWWGRQYKLSNSKANALIAAIAGGVGTATIVALVCGGTVAGAIPCGIAYGVVAGLLTIGGAGVSYCNRKGRGININVTWVGTVTCSTR